jgi:outer membrane receptor protein involved in Fe transport
VGQAFAGGQTVTINGLNAKQLLYCNFSSCISNPALLRKTNVDYVKPEQVKAFELGYRSFIEGFSVDVNGYNIYNDFIGNLNVVVLYMVPLKILKVVFQALTLDFSLFMLANSKSISIVH